MAQNNPSSLDQQTDLYPKRARGADRAVQAVPFVLVMTKSEPPWLLVDTAQNSPNSLDQQTDSQTPSLGAIRSVQAVPLGLVIM